MQLNSAAMHLCTSDASGGEVQIVMVAFAAILDLASPQCFSEHSLHGRRAVTLASLESTEKAVDTEATHCTFGGPLQYHQPQQGKFYCGAGDS